MRLRTYHKGVYTVEAAMVFSICFLIIGSIMCLTYDIYAESLGYVKEMKQPEHDAVKRFREIDALLNLADSVKGLGDKESNYDAAD